jgi:hypothetical protein
MLRSIVCLCLSTLLIGCGSSDEQGETPAPSNVLQLRGPKFTVPAGTETFSCMRIPYEAKETIFVNASNAFQAEGGHHSMLYYLPPEQSAREDPHECEGAEMGRGGLRFVGVGTGDGHGIALPPGIAMKIPAGIKLFTQAHYLNTTSHDVVAEDLINLTTLPENEVVEIAGTFTQIDLSFELAARLETTRTVECTAPVDMTVPFLIPHMHEFGKHITVELEQGGVKQTLYDSDWSAALRDDFPVRHFTEHLKFQTADKLRTSCTWSNTEDFPMLFPREMCATFMMFYPSIDGAMWACDETGRNFHP